MNGFEIRAKVGLAALAAALVCVPLALGVAGCGGDGDDGGGEGVGCAAMALPAVEVVIYDAETGAPAGSGATGTLTDGDYTEQMYVYRFDTQNVRSLGGALDRVGTYTVRIEKPGYEPWERTGVRTTSDVCGVNTTELRADLRPLRP